MFAYIIVSFLFMALLSFLPKNASVINKKMGLISTIGEIQTNRVNGSITADGVLLDWFILIFVRPTYHTTSTGLSSASREYSGFFTTKPQGKSKYR